MDPQNQRLRLQALSNTSPSIRQATAPLQVTTAHPGNLYIADSNGRPTNQYIAPGGGTAGGAQDPVAAAALKKDNQSTLGQTANVFGNTAADLVRFVPQFAENYANTFANLGNKAAGAPDAPIQENLGGGSLLNQALKFSQATGKNSQLAGDVGQIAGAALAAGPEAFGTSALTKGALDAALGAGVTTSNTLATNPKATLGDYFKSAAIGAGTGLGARLGLGLVGAAKKAIVGNPSTVGLTNDTLNFVKNSSDANQIHALLSSIYGGSSDALQAAAEQIAGSDSKKFIIHTLEDLPLESAGAGAVAAAASDGIAREKYGNSPITGETAPVAPPPTVPEINLDTGGGGIPAEGAPGIQLNSTKLPDEDLAAIKAAGGDTSVFYHGSTNPNLTNLTPGAETGLNEKRNLLYLADSKEGAGPYAKTRGTDGNGLGALADSKDGTIYRVGLKGQVLDATDMAARDALKQSPEYEALSAKTKNQLGYDNIDADVLESNPELVKFLSDNGVSGVKTHLPNTVDQKQIVVTKPSAASVLPAEDIAAIKAAGGEVPQPVAETAAASGAPASSESASPAPAETAPSTPIDPASEAKQQVMDSLSGATRDYNKAASVRTAERGARSAQADAAFEAAGGGQAGVYAKLGALKGDYTKSDFGIVIDPEAKNTLHDAIQSNAALQPFEKANAQVALMKLTGDAAGGPTPFDIKMLRKAFGEDFGQAVQTAVDDGKTFGQKASNLAGDVAGLPKSVMASGDLSATFRQGGILASRFYKEWASATSAQLKYFANDENFKKGMAAIAAKPNFQEKLDAGLALNGTEALDKSEELFVSNLAEKLHIPLVARSDRAYTGMLSDFRDKVYDTITIGKDYTPKELSDIAKFINTATGRGDLGQYLEQHSKTLSTALFSPRLWKSRLDMLNPFYYAKLSGPARKYALQTAGTFAAEASAILSLASLAPGVTVETNPKSADFGKIKYHNTRYDILGGLQQNLVFAAREISGETKNSQTGETTKLGSKVLGKDRLSLAGDMIQNKENPLFAAATSILRGKDRGGNPVNPFTTLAQLAVPLPISGVFQNAQDIGSAKNPIDLAKGALMNAPDVVGISAQTYGSIPTKNQGKPDANGQPTYKGPIEANMVTDFNGKAVLDQNGKPVTVTFPNGASDLTKQSMLDDARGKAVKAQYERSLPQQTQELIKLSDPQLKDYVKDGTITQGDYDHIKNVQKTSDSVSKNNVYAVPDGAVSPEAKQYYQHYNSMDAKDQKAWLDQPADTNSQHITQQVNASRSKGLAEFKPSNKLAKLYADYENDINTHKTGDDAYGAIDLRNRAKTFQTNAAKLNFSSGVNDLYTEGGSNDTYTLAKDGKITKSDMDQAINLDNQLYASGLTSSLKFSKKFRNAFGYATPTNGPADSSGGGGSKSGVSQQLASLVKTPTTKAVPKFSAAARTNPVKIIKFTAPAGTIPAAGSSRVTAGGFKTTKLTSLRNSVAN